ncbi:F-box/LRR-repeat protein At4g14103-like [Silene latifolia]|uniref:F-box/LRR-repeat protein At4g14103-like n=1 Tax=Silene latifolia TaxID=37657 RepID=UPI003D78A534
MESKDMDLSSENRKRGKGCLNEKHDTKRAKKKVNTKVDYISELPEPVLHQILSLLHPKDAARTCILSKRWQQAWNSYQILDFDLRRSHKMQKRLVDKQKNAMNHLLNCRKEQLLNIFKFRLRFIVNKKLLQDVDGWISAVIERNVKELEIQAKSIQSVQFCLPMSVLRASSITALNLSGCILPTSGIKADLPHLQKLSLKKMNIPMAFLVSLFSCCPLIDDLRFIECTGFKILSIGSCNQLKRVDVHKCHGLKSVVMESPKLESFWYFYEKKKVCTINLVACRALKDLVLEYPRMNDELFHEIISELPLLEKLVLSRCYGLKTIQISGDKLKKLVIRRCRKLADAQVNTPNLVSLEYCGQGMPLSCCTFSHLKEAFLRFEPTSKNTIAWKPEEANRLQNFFVNNHFRGLKLMTWNKEKVDIFEDKCVLFDPLSKIKKSNSVKLSACFRDLLTEALQTWPYASKLLVYSFGNSEFSEDIYKELNQGKIEPKCCAYFKNKCWRHYLKNITSEKWFCRSNEQSLSLAGPEWQYTQFELDWNTDKRGWKKEIPPFQASKSPVELITHHL